MKSPIRKLLVLTNQSISFNSTSFAYKCFELINNVYTKYIRNKKQETMFPDIGFSNFSSFIFKVNHVLIEKEDNPSKIFDKNKLDCSGIEDIQSLEDLPRIEFID